MIQAQDGLFVSVLLSASLCLFSLPNAARRAMDRRQPDHSFIPSIRRFGWIPHSQRWPCVRILKVRHIPDRGSQLRFSNIHSATDRPTTFISSPRWQHLEAEFSPPSPRMATVCYPGRPWRPHSSRECPLFFSRLKEKRSTLHEQRVHCSKPQQNMCLRTSPTATLCKRSLSKVLDSSMHMMPSTRQRFCQRASYS